MIINSNKKNNVNNKINNKNEKFNLLIYNIIYIDIY